MAVTPEELVRDALYNITGYIDDESVSGLVFGVGLVVTDHVFQVINAVEKLVTLPWRLFGGS